ncbi:hypothetical protein ACJX0J_026935, partial [Zea mays]
VIPFLSFFQNVGSVERVLQPKQLSGIEISMQFEDGHSSKALGFLVWAFLFQDSLSGLFHVEAHGTTLFISTAHFLLPNVCLFIPKIIGKLVAVLQPKQLSGIEISMQFEDGHSSKALGFLVWAFLFQDSLSGLFHVEAHGTTLFISTAHFLLPNVCLFIPKIIGKL